MLIISELVKSDMSWLCSNTRSVTYNRLQSVTMVNKRVFCFHMDWTHGTIKLHSVTPLSSISVVEDLDNLFQDSFKKLSFIINNVVLVDNGSKSCFRSKNYTGFDIQLLQCNSFFRNFPTYYAIGVCVIVYYSRNAPCLLQSVKR